MSKEIYVELSKNNFEKHNKLLLDFVKREGIQIENKILKRGFILSCSDIDSYDNLTSFLDINYINWQDN